MTELFASLERHRRLVVTPEDLWRHALVTLAGPHRRCIAVDLVENDTGGAVAQVFAATRSDRVRTMALTNCEAHDNVPPRAFKPTVRLARARLLRRLTPRPARHPDRARRIAFGSGYEAIEHWLADTPPNVTGLVELAGARLFFPDERVGDLVGQLRRLQHARPRGALSPARVDAA